jgi:predicted nucleic acid-binding protein
VSLFVLDASVAAKWYLAKSGETLVDRAKELLERYTKQEIQLIVPDLFWVEMANVFWKAVRVGRFPKTSAETSIDSLVQLDFPTVPSENLFSSAFQIATAYDRTVYDSMYVALAVQSEAQLITADERLVNSLAARFPVKWLGAVWNFTE